MGHKFVSITEPISVYDCTSVSVTLETAIQSAEELEFIQGQNSAFGYFALQDDYLRPEAVTFGANIPDFQPMSDSVYEDMMRVFTGTQEPEEEETVDDSESTEKETTDPNDEETSPVETENEKRSSLYDCAIDDRPCLGITLPLIEDINEGILLEVQLQATFNQGGYYEIESTLSNVFGPRSNYQKVGYCVYPTEFEEDDGPSTTTVECIAVDLDLAPTDGETSGLPAGVESTSFLTFEASSDEEVRKQLMDRWTSEAIEVESIAVTDGYCATYQGGSSSFILTECEYVETNLLLYQPITDESDYFRDIVGVKGTFLGFAVSLDASGAVTT